jgi:F0F1-type ATP synthase assembly protein I
LEKKKPYNNYLKYSNIVFQQVAAVILGGWIGKMLDGYFANSTLYFTALGALLGTCAGLYFVLKIVLAKPEDEEK